jgi:hypothetical protein
MVPSKVQTEFFNCVGHAGWNFTGMSSVLSIPEFSVLGTPGL